MILIALPEQIRIPHIVIGNGTITCASSDSATPISIKAIHWLSLYQNRSSHEPSLYLESVTARAALRDPEDTAER